MENDTTIKITSGSSFAQHNMFLLENGDLYAFGKNDFGQCGVGSTDDLKTPTKVMNNPDIVSIQLGMYHSLILESNGDLYVCGLNMNNEFGSQNDSNITKFVKIAEKVKKVRASKFTIIQTFDDKLFFIGLFLEEMHNTFTQINIEGVKSFYVGSDHCFFLKDNGEIYVLGSNSSGQIGIGYDSYAYLPQLITTNKNIITICCGYEHTVIVSRGVEGVQLVCLGNNYDGELGFLDKANQYDPVTIVAHPDVKAIHCGNNHTIILKNNGTVFSTGVNEDGQLCLGNTKNVSQYTKIDLSDIESVTSGSQHSILVNEKGEVFVSGSNEYGQLGLGDNESRNSPTPLKLEHKIKLLNNFEQVVHVHEPTDEDNEENKN